MLRFMTVADTKAQLSALLADVERGETVTITRHGRPVAILAPLPAPKRRQGGEFLDNPAWDAFVAAPDLFAPLSDEEARAEGWE